MKIYSILIIITIALALAGCGEKALPPDNDKVYDILYRVMDKDDGNYIRKVKSDGKSAPVTMYTTKDAVLSDIRNGRVMISDFGGIFGRYALLDWTIATDTKQLINKATSDSSSGILSCQLSPTSQQIAYVQTMMRVTVPTSLYVANADGSSPRFIDDSVIRVLPQYSPDASLLAYFVQGNVLKVTNLLNSTTTSYTGVWQGGMEMWQVSLSPNNQEVIVQTDTATMAVVSMSSGARRSFNTDSTSYTGGIWSADGSKIYAVQRIIRNGVVVRRIVSLRSDGSDIQVLSPDYNQYIVRIRLSPNGTSLAYSVVTMNSIRELNYTVSKPSILNLDTKRIVSLLPSTTDYGFDAQWVR